MSDNFIRLLKNCVENQNSSTNIYNTQKKIVYIKVLLWQFSLIHRSKLVKLLGMTTEWGPPNQC